MITKSEAFSKKDIENLKRDYGRYVKVTVDLENKLMIVGTELHADGEKILLEKGAKSDNIWGGGVDLENRTIDTTAVLNIRPRVYNDSMEILDLRTRKKFIKIVRLYFKNYGIK